MLPFRKEQIIVDLLFRERKKKKKKKKEKKEKEKASVRGTAINIDLLFDCRITACCFRHRAKLNNRWKRSNDTVRRYRRAYFSQRATIMCTITCKLRWNWEGRSRSTEIDRDGHFENRTDHGSFLRCLSKMLINPTRGCMRKWACGRW